MIREKKFVKNTIILSLGTVIPKFASIITLPIITATLSHTEYGTYDLITVLISFLLPITTLQIQMAAFRFLIRDKNNKKERYKVIITNLFTFAIPTSLITLLVLFSVLYRLLFIVRLLIIAYFLTDIIIGLLRQVARGMSKNGLYSFSVMVDTITQMLLIVLFLGVFNWNLIGLLMAIILGQFLAIIIIMFKIHIIQYIDLKCISKFEIISLIKYSWPMVPGSLSSWVIRVSDRLIVSAFLGIKANAIYAVANKIPSMFGIFQSTFSLSWQESASLAVNDLDSSQYYERMFNNIFNVLVGGMAILIACTPVLFTILIRGDYDSAYNQLSILYMGVFFSSISSYLGGIYVAKMKTKQCGISTALAAVCNLVLDFILIGFVGIYAASISTLLSYFILSLYRMKDVQRFQPLKFDWKKFWLCISFLAFMAILCALHSYVTNLINMILGISICIVLNRHLIVETVKAINDFLGGHKL